MTRATLAHYWEVTDMSDTYRDTDETHPCGCPATVVTSILPHNREQCSSCGQTFTHHEANSSAYVGAWLDWLTGKEATND
jgi:hypothetical protein